MDRDIEILFEIIADNYNLLQKQGDFDCGLYEEICRKYNFDIEQYLNPYGNRI